MYSKVKRVIPAFVLVALILSIATAASAKGKVQLSGVVNINTASVNELTVLPGIGKSKAEAISSYRKTQKFKNVDELTKVRGIGKSLLTNIRAYVTVDGPTTAKLDKRATIK